MRKLFYKVNHVNERFREITVFSGGLLLCELECLSNHLTNEEEIQQWLDDNGYGDEEFDFEKI